MVGIESFTKKKNDLMENLKTILISENWSRFDNIDAPKDASIVNRGNG